MPTYGERNHQRDKSSSRVYFVFPLRVENNGNCISPTSHPLYRSWCPKTSVYDGNHNLHSLSKILSLLPEELDTDNFCVIFLGVITLIKSSGISGRISFSKKSAIFDSQNPPRFVLAEFITASCNTFANEKATLSPYGFTAATSTDTFLPFFNSNSSLSPTSRQSAARLAQISVSSSSHDVL